MFEKRPQYYQAIEAARKANDSGAFIEFTLSALNDTIKTQDKHEDKHQVKHQVRHQDKHQVELTDTRLAILVALEAGGLSRKEIFTAIGMSGDTRAFNRNIAPLLAGGLIEMTVSDKPNSKLQKYRLTDAGRAAVR